MMIDIGCKILMRINDDDNHVKVKAYLNNYEIGVCPNNLILISIPFYFI